MEKLNDELYHIFLYCHVFDLISLNSVCKKINSKLSDKFIVTNLSSGQTNCLDLYIKDTVINNSKPYYKYLYAYRINHKFFIKQFNDICDDYSNNLMWLHKNIPDIEKFYMRLCMSSIKYKHYDLFDMLLNNMGYSGIYDDIEYISVRILQRLCLICINCKDGVIINKFYNFVDQLKYDPSDTQYRVGIQDIIATLKLYFSKV